MILSRLNRHTTAGTCRHSPVPKICRPNFEKALQDPPIGLNTTAEQDRPGLFSEIPRPWKTGESRHTQTTLHFTLPHE